MNCFSHKAIVALAGAGLLLVNSPSASAQGGGRGGRGGRMGGPIPAVTLATLEEVQADLKLTDAQKTKVAVLSEELNQQRRETAQDAGGDFVKMREATLKLYDQTKTKLNAGLDEPQQKRIQEIYLQVNGPVALSEAAIASALKLSDDQKQQIQQRSDESRQKMADIRQDLQSLSDEERTAKIAGLNKTRDEALMAILTDQQREEFDKMKGEKLEIDLSKLPRGGGRGASRVQN